jgi:hypothetical protein
MLGVLGVTQINRPGIALEVAVPVPPENESVSLCSCRS